jgi:hypothetical protein
MKKRLVLVFVMCGVLLGCEDKPKADLSCEDTLKGCSKAEKQANADSSFFGGSFKKSPPKAW